MEGLQSDNDCQKAGQQEEKKKREREWETNKLTNLQLRKFMHAFHQVYSATTKITNSTLPPPAPYSDLFPLKPFSFLSQSALFSADVFWQISFDKCLLYTSALAFQE